MDKRTLIAFILALLVIIYYPHYLKKLYPPKIPTVTEEIPLEEKLEPKTEYQPPQIITTPEVPEEETTITTPLMEITFSNYEATIKRIRLLEYLDKNGNPIELISPFPTNHRPMATNLPQISSVYTLSKEGNTLTYANTSDSLKITKIYSISPESYAITINLALENTGNKEITIPNYNASVGTIFPGDESQAIMYLGTTNLIDGRPIRNRLGKPGFRTTHIGKIFWSGLKNKYFSLILKPQTPGNMVTVSDYQIEGKRGITSQITMPQINIPTGEKIEETFLLYAGPKKYEILKSLGSDLYKITDLGSLSIITLYILNFFYRLIHNYGIAIILLTILVRIILYPLTLKSYKSMSAMHKLQPYIQELQKKYKDEPKRMQKEMMLLYKEHKVNPFSGCFPMLLQMPILIALFTTLRSAIELRGAPFILWIKDLSEPDTLARLPNGFAINILPIFLIATMFFQQKMTTMPATTEQQKQQQKMMGTIMPIFMGFIFYNMPSGLVLYFGLSTLLGLFDQYRIEKAKNKNLSK